MTSLSPTSASSTVFHNPAGGMKKVGCNQALLKLLTTHHIDHPIEQYILRKTEKHQQMKAVLRHQERHVFVKQYGDMSYRTMHICHKMNQKSICLHYEDA
jgi:hypothetical protein